MKMVVAYVRHEAFEPIREELLERGFPSISITEVKGPACRKRTTGPARGPASAVSRGKTREGARVWEEGRVPVRKVAVVPDWGGGRGGEGKIFLPPEGDPMLVMLGTNIYTPM